MRHNHIPLTVALCLALFCACEKPILSEDMPSAEQGNLTLSISQLEQTSFASLTRAAASDVCTHLNFAVYDLEGTRLKQTNQKVGESDASYRSAVSSSAMPSPKV